MSRKLLSRIKRRLERTWWRKEFTYPADCPAQLVEVWKSVKNRRLTYLSDEKISSLLQCAISCERDGVPGCFIEAGCALGGSAILLAHAKNHSRELGVYDVFGMIPPPSERDGADVHERYAKIANGAAIGIDGDSYYGYENDLYSVVQRHFSEHGVPVGQNGVVLHKGLVEDTLVIEGPVALAHIDVDWFEPVMTCLQRIIPNLAIGGAVVLDDYHDWSGCRRATDEYWRTIDRSKYVRKDRAGHLVISRIK